MFSGFNGFFRRLTATQHTARSNLLNAEETAKMLGPKHYVIKNQNAEFNTASIGCFGENSEEQKLVAALMDSIGNFDYVFGAGDNFYKFGLNSANDIRAVHEFEHVYRDTGLPRLSKKMFIEIPGNHDESLCNLDSYIEGSLSLTGKYKEAIRNTLPTKFKPPGEHGEARAKHEVELTFRRLPRDLFETGELDPAIHQGWVMPHFYNTYTDGTVDVCAVDSNTILQYYLSYLSALINGDAIDPNNQHVFMKSHFDSARAASHGIILLQHHPLISSSKQRDEADTYLDMLEVKQLDRLLQLNIADDNFLTTANKILSVTTEAELEAMRGIPPATANPLDYERLLREYYRQQGMEFDLVICAHDHNISYFNNNITNAGYKIRQITTGGGGAPPSDLMSRKYYDRQDLMGCFLKKNGFTRITCSKDNPRLIYIDVYTTDGLHLRFSNVSHEPIRTPSEEQAAENLRRSLLDACHTYLKQDQKVESTGYLKNTYTHTDEQDDCAHHLWAYLSQPVLPSVEDIRAKLKELIGSLPESSKTVRTSFYRILNKKLLEGNQPRIEALLSPPEPLEAGWGTMSSKF